MNDTKYALIISAKEAKERVEDVNWFMKHCKARGFRFSADKKELMIVFDNIENFKLGCQIAEERYKTYEGCFQLI